MATKRLNIMLYSENNEEQIVLPINPKSIEIKYEKSFDTYEILGFGEVNIMAYHKPIRITLSHFLPENNSIFETYLKTNFRLKKPFLFWKNGQKAKQK